MAYRKGQDVFVMILGTAGTATTWADYNPIAGQQGATLTRGSDSFSYTVKGNNWTYNEATYRNWEVSCNGLFVLDDTAFEQLQTDFLAGNDVTVAISFDAPLAGGGGEQLPATDDVWYYGTAIMTDFSVENPQDNMVSYTVTLMGKGELTAITVV